MWRKQLETARAGGTDGRADGVLGLLRKVQPRVTYVNKVVSMASKLFMGMAVSLKAKLTVANATALALRTGSRNGRGGRAVRGGGGLEFSITYTFTG
jgi:hypothetical protein